ncbi:AraC family transcriptional regulator [Paraburkholderia acidicola]|uniref:AraC family transcriptional regulator n=1 Tax=Paraburkholderia acidicola TaxID=1912599 RepID=A0ABV1LM84_9BURK
MPIKRVTGAWTHLLCDWLDAEALPAARLRAELAALADDEVVAMETWQSLLERATAMRPAVLAPGLQIGALVEPRHVGVLGYLVLASDTVGEALLVYRRYERLFYGVDLAEIEIDAQDVEIRWPASVPAVSQVVDDVAIAALVTFIARQVNAAPAPSRISFVHTPPADSDTQSLYEKFFGCPVDFGDVCTRVRFPASYLMKPMAHADPGLRALLDRQAQALLLAQPDPDAFERAVQESLLKLLPEGAPTISRVAQVLHMSARTLQRRLEAGGETWQSMLDRTREHLARQYLLDRSLSLSDIALLLGYSEQSAFNRAFRRWTDETPARARRGERDA